MKKLFNSFIAFSFLTITACGQPGQNFSLAQQDFGQSEQFAAAAKKRMTIRSDWFESLRPELQAYYAPARGKTGTALFDALHDIISKNQKVSDYGASKSFMYSTVDNLKVNGKTGLYDAYSYIFLPGSGGNGNLYKENGDLNKDGEMNDFINCEHTWPQSFFDKRLPMVSDLHHLFPTLSVPNNRRGHHPIGMVKGSVIYSTVGGSKLGVTDKTGRNRPVMELKKIFKLPYEQQAEIMDRELDAVFEPLDRQKGNTARALLYFYLRYYDQGIKSGEFEENAFWDSKISTFINWAEKVDPVDENEVARHNIVFQKQNNRNPFIDIPNLASMIGEEVLRNK